MMSQPIILIPARMGSTRLYGKPLADINGKPMIVHVVERAMEARLGPVYVATDHSDIKTTVENFGFRALMTAGDHESGSDRIYEALQQLDSQQQFDVVINVQGDLPTISGGAIRAALKPLNDSRIAIATLGVEISQEDEKNNPNVVKIIGTPVAHQRLRALYFTRATAPYGDGPLYHHIGLYAYQRAALEQFINFPPSALEKREHLEQLRALENNMRVDVTIIEALPIGVDTAADLEAARRMLKNRVRSVIDNEDE